MTTPETQQPLSSRIINREEGRVGTRTVAVGAIVIVLAGMGALRYKDDINNTQEGAGQGLDYPTGDQGFPTPQLTSGNFDEAQEPQVVTDDELSEGGFNCGKGVDTFFKNGDFSYTSMFEFYEDKPVQVKEIYQLNVSDPQYGMGIEAWDVLLSQGLKNPDTDATKNINTGDANIDDDMTQYLQRMSRVEVGSPRTYINFTCEGGVRPVGMIRLGASQNKNAVNGIVLTEESLEAFNKVALNRDRFDTVYVGKGEDKKGLYLVVLTADGCKNPIRRPLKPPIVPINPVPAPQPTGGESPSPEPTYEVKIPGKIDAPEVSTGKGDPSSKPETGEGPEADDEKGYDPDDEPATVTPRPTPTPTGTTGPENPGTTSSPAATAAPSPSPSPSASSTNTAPPNSPNTGTTPNQPTN